jgi:hypothetical protein
VHPEAELSRRRHRLHPAGPPGSISKVDCHCVDVSPGDRRGTRIFVNSFRRKSCSSRPGRARKAAFPLPKMGPLEALRPHSLTATQLD